MTYRKTNDQRQTRADRATRERRRIADGLDGIVRRLSEMSVRLRYEHIKIERCLLGERLKDMRADAADLIRLADAIAVLHLNRELRAGQGLTHPCAEHSGTAPGPSPPGAVPSPENQGAARSPGDAASPASRSALASDPDRERAADLLNDEVGTMNDE